MAFDLSATGPRFFMQNGYNFEKRITDDGTVLIHLPFYCVGIVSGNRIYFDENSTFMLGDFSMELWGNTLNYAMSDDANINTDFVDTRKNLQDYLNEKRARETQAVLARINYTVYDDHLLYDSENDENDENDNEDEDDELTDYEDFYDNETADNLLPVG
jgi:hypothetical protein